MHHRKMISGYPVRRRRYGSLATHRVPYEDYDLTAQIHRLICLFAGHTGNLEWNSIPRLNYQCALGEISIGKDTKFLIVDNEDSDQTSLMWKLIWVFIGSIYQKVDFSRCGSFFNDRFYLSFVVATHGFRESGFDYYSISYSSAHKSRSNVSMCVY